MKYQLMSKMPSASISPQSPIHGTTGDSFSLNNNHDYSILKTTTKTPSYNSLYCPAAGAFNPSTQNFPILINLSFGQKGPSPAHFIYELKEGVTMVGTGKGCVLPPDIILHSPAIAPQHFFIEKINSSDLILHPISELTFINNQKIYGPVSLAQGDIIRIGDSQLLQYQVPNEIKNQHQISNKLRNNEESSNQSFSHMESLNETEPKYAIITKKGRANPGGSAGDVNKNSFSKKIMDHSNHSSSHSSGRQPLYGVLKKQNAVEEDDYYDNFRNGADFMSKLAQFENMKNESRGNSKVQRPLVSQLSLPNFQEKPISCRRPSPYYSRYGTSSQFRYFSEDASDDHSLDCIVASPEAVPTLGYRRTFSSSSSSSTFDHNKLDKKTKSSSESEHIYRVELDSSNNLGSSNSLSLSTLHQSSPSPDSLYSSHSSNSISLLGYNQPNFGNYNAQVSQISVNNKGQMVRSGSLSSYDENLTRHQTQRHDEKFSTSSERSVTESLDEVLAICAEYDRQISKELEEKKLNSNLRKAKTINQTKINKTIDEAHPLKRPHNLFIIRAHSEPVKNENSGSTQNHAYHHAEQSINSSHKLDNGYQISQNRTLSSESSDNVFTPSPQNDESKRLLPPYENIFLVQNESESSVLKDSSSSKSKLSVSFSPSVQEFPVDESFHSKISPGENSPKLKPILNGSNSVVGNPIPIITKVATKAQVHHPQISSIGQSPIEIELKEESEIARIEHLNLNDAKNAESSLVDDQISLIKEKICDVEQNEIEALREMEIEKALLKGEEKSLEAQLILCRDYLEKLRVHLSQIDDGISLWKNSSSQKLLELNSKIENSEEELKKLEKLHEEFCGTTDEETALLEKIKFHHELIESIKKRYEDDEFQENERELNRELQREELRKEFEETQKKLSVKQNELELLRNQNKVSIGSSAKEIQALEKKRQELIIQLQKCRESVKNADTQIINESFDTNTSSASDSDEGRNSELEGKIKALSSLALAGDDVTTIERIKCSSPINVCNESMGAKLTETLKEINRNREYKLNEKGVEILESERERVREMQKRVQEAVREEWESAKKNKKIFSHSLNSVGSEDSGQTSSDSPTTTNSTTDHDRLSGSSDDATFKSIQPFLESDVSFNGKSNGNEESSFQHHQTSQQMRHRHKELSECLSGENRPLSDGSTYDSSIVMMRDNHRPQNNRPLTRYLPVRNHDDIFDLRAHIESSGHQLELCPHVLITSTYAKGFLNKLGSRFSNWNKRWFVFDRETRTLSYYSDKNEKKARGGIHFQAIEEVYVDHLQSVKSPSPKLTFCVKTKSRIFHLVAPSPEALRIWIDIIFTGAEGYQEFKSHL